MILVPKDVWNQAAQIEQLMGHRMQKKDMQVYREKTKTLVEKMSVKVLEEV